MVALGSEINENAGIKSFLLEHSQELRGSIIVDIEGLGAGQLSLISSEGVIKKSKTPSRLKRYVRQASNKLGYFVKSICEVENCKEQIHFYCKECNLFFQFHRLNILYHILHNNHHPHFCDIVRCSRNPS